MSSKLREVLKELCAVDFGKLMFPLDGDSSAIYNSDKKEITIPYWRVAELLNEVKAAQDMAKSALAEPVRNCDVGTAEEQEVRFRNYCWNHSSRDKNMECQCPIDTKGKAGCKLEWSQMPYEKEGAE